jgi:hypothetical protein
MGFGKDSPDYEGAAQAQGEANEKVATQQTWANRPTQYTPFGYTDWSTEQVIDPGTGDPVTRWSQQQFLTPELQSILNKQIAIQGGRSDLAGLLTGRMQDEFGSSMDWSGLSPLAPTPYSQFTMPEGAVGDPNAFRQQGADASYNAAMSRINPAFQEQRRAAEVKMRNQGLRPGDSAWEAQMSQIGTQENDARNQAIWGAQQAGRAESALNWGQGMQQNQNMFQQALGANQQNYGQAMQGANYANQLRQQQLAETMQQRGYSLNEINALLSGQQVQNPQMPNFMGAQQAQAAPIYQGAVDQGNFDQASSAWAGLGSLAGTLGGAYLGGGGTFGGLIPR